MNDRHRDPYLMHQAELAASLSPDPSTQVGALAVSPDLAHFSQGCNDFPKGVAATPERLADRAFKYPVIVHAEVNAVLGAGQPVRGWTLYATMHPCARCAGVLVQAGITCVVCPPVEASPDRWHEEMGLAALVLREAGVEVRRPER